MSVTPAYGADDTTHIFIHISNDRPRCNLQTFLDFGMDLNIKNVPTITIQTPKRKSRKTETHSGTLP